MKLAALAALALAACDPIYQLTTHVTTADGEPIAGASLSISGCPEQNDHDIATVASLTDASGDASVGGLGFQFPACDIAVAAPGFQPFASSFDELCDGHLDDCDRVQTIDVVLDVDPAATSSRR